MAHGGKRPGSGRHKGTKLPRTLKREEARNYLAQRVLAEIQPLATAAIECAKGLVFMMKPTTQGYVRVTDPAEMERLLNAGEDAYKLVAKEPDIRALKDIFDREFGRPTEHVAVTGADGGPVQVRFVDVA